MPEYVKILRNARSIGKNVVTRIDHTLYDNPFGRAVMSALASYNIFNGITRPGVEGLGENSAIFVPMSIMLSITVGKTTKDLYRLGI